MAATTSPRRSCVIGIDVGGTNTDAVIIEGERVLEWHKTPTTPDIQGGVEVAIEEVLRKAKLPGNQVESVKIGTTQFVNAVVEQDSSKLDKVAVIRLCGPYSRGSPPFVDFPPTLRKLVEGHFGYVDGGYQVDGTPISDLNVTQLQEQASVIRSKSIASIVVIGVYSPSNSAQEERAKEILASELGPGFDISCSHAIGRIGFLERENASILNASLRRFARHVIAGLASAVKKVGNCNLYITLNDGTLSKASTAAQYPVKCFRSGPTNSARGAAALLAKTSVEESDDREVLVIDIGGTTTDICTLLPNGYPRQSAAFVKIAGVRTNFTIPDVHNVALGGGSIIRQIPGRISVGPDSVGARLEAESMHWGGNIMTTTDLILSKDETLVPQAIKDAALKECLRILEEAIDIVKTKQGDAKVILVGGGSIIIGDHINGVGEVIKPEYFEVANAVGAAIGKASGAVEKMVIPEENSIEQEIEEAKKLAIERCVTAGGNPETIEVVEVEFVPISYVTNGATQLYVRVVGDLVEGYEETFESPESTGEVFDKPNLISMIPNSLPDNHKGSSYDIIENVDLESYRPRIEGDLWHLSEIDLQFLSDGTGVLGVGSCGEPYPTHLALLEVLRSGGDLTIRRQDTFPDDGVALVIGLMGAPSIYVERIPGLHEIADAIKSQLRITNHETFDAIITHEIGGLNAFEALLAAHRFGKSALDTDLVARAYPMVYQSIRCLNGMSVTPASIADGSGKEVVFPDTLDNVTAEEVMRNASVSLGSLAGACLNPILGTEAKTLPPNSFSYAWTIGRCIAISRSLKLDPISTLLSEHHGSLLFTGKITSVTRFVSKGFTRGNVFLDEISRDDPSRVNQKKEGREISSRLFVDFENENLNAILKVEGKDDELLAICPDLITFLDLANGAPLGVADYKYGLRVSVVALPSPPQWVSEKGLKMGGPRAFGLDIDYKSATSLRGYEPPKSVWELYGES